MDKFIQGKISITFSIPKEFEDNDELCEKYIQYITEQLAKNKILKDCEDAMLIGELEKTKDEYPWFNYKDYYREYYDAVFPEDFFENDLVYQLNVCKVAKKWYLKFHTVTLKFEDIQVFNEDLNKYNVNYDDVNTIMKDYYIEYLENEIKRLKND